MKAVIFDFDGTIADTFAVVIKLFEELIGRPVTADERRRLHGMPLTHAVRELKIPLWHLPFLLVRGRRKTRRAIHQIAIFDGMAASIKALHAAGITVMVMSSNSSSNVRKFLTDKELNTYFDQIHGGVGFFAKARTLKQIMRRTELSSADCVYVGDEVRDIEAARAAGIRSIAVTWGFNDAKLLAQHEPSGLATSAEELVQIVQDYYNKDHRT